VFASSDDSVPITNFGGNIRFVPRYRYAPTTEAEVLDLLDRHAGGRVRVVGALHSWSPAVVTEDALIDLRHFNRVAVEQGPEGKVWVTAGGGCRIKHLLRELHAQSGATLPTMGLVTEQTIAGAISTGTHGSGRPSLSHYMDEIRVAAYDADTGKARIYVWNEGAELRAARCALGRMGVVLSVRFRAVPKYDVAETITPSATLDEVLALEDEFPLQQFFLIPHRYCYLVQRRRAVAPASPPRRSWSARLYRAYWLLGLDVGFHLVVKLLASVLGSPALIRWFYRRALPFLVLRNRTVVDTSDRMLIMEHELFKHLEIEIFVPRSQVRRADEFVRHVLAAFDDRAAVIPEETSSALKQIGMYEALLQLRGTFTHHYPIAFRRVLPDETLISMASGSDEPYYAISFITYVEPRDRFFELASFLARSMTALFGARPHWGKYFPLTCAETERVYPHLEEFRRLCRKTDPRGVFRNEYTDRVLGFGVQAGTSQGEGLIHG
jgi:FAD/FMN-containing dehydrogenase